MSNKKEINNEQLLKVNGGQDIINNSEEITREESLQRTIQALQDELNRCGNSYVRAMELANQIATLLRELNELSNDTGSIVNNK